MVFLKFVLQIVAISNKLLFAQKECVVGLFPELFQNTKDLDQNFVQPSTQPLTLPFSAISGQSCGWAAGGLREDTI